MAAWRKILIAFIALTACVAAAASGSSDAGSSGGDKGSSDSASSDSGSTDTGDANEVKDVKISSCGKDEAGFVKADVSVTNSSSKASDYIIEVTFTSKDGKTQVGTGNTFIQNLAPGQTKNDSANSLETTDIEFDCTISKVDRTESL